MQIGKAVRGMGSGVCENVNNSWKLTLTAHRNTTRATSADFTATVCVCVANSRQVSFRVHLLETRNYFQNRFMGANER